MVIDKGLTKEQETRYKLRQSFLNEIIKLKGMNCHILTYERSKLEALFSIWKPDGSEMLVFDLKTPANIIMQSAIIRMPDVIAIRFTEFES